MTKYSYACVSVFLLMLSACAPFDYHGDSPVRYHDTGIFPYDRVRDKKAMLQLFSDNKYWLFPADNALDSEYFFDHCSPTMNVADHNRESIMVYRIGGSAIGLVSYYIESAGVGRIHFLVIDEPYRGKGYSQKLMHYALQDLKKEGAKKVWLVTRMDNLPAQRLYLGLGFKNGIHNTEYVCFEKYFD